MPRTPGTPGPLGGRPRSSGGRTAPAGTAGTRCACSASIVLALRVRLPILLIEAAGASVSWECHGSAEALLVRSGVPGEVVFWSPLALLAAARIARPGRGSRAGSAL